MVVEDDIREFKKWAENLGFPEKSLPPQKTLKRIFQSGQMLSFIELMRRISPQQEVKELRDEIKVRQIERVNSLIAMVKKSQSEQLFLYQKKKRLEERLENQKARVCNQKLQYKKLATTSKESNIQKLQLIEEIADIRAKNAICRLKTHDIDRQIDAEKEIGKNIDKTTPVKFTIINGMEKNALAALIAAKNELQKFCSSLNQTENYEVNMASRQQFWQKLRDILAQIPNLVIWTSIVDQMKQKLSTLETLSIMDMEKVLYVDAGYQKPDPKNYLQLEMGKLHAKHVKLCVIRHGINKKSEHVINEYVVFYESFLMDLRAKFTMYNNQSIDDDFLGDYLSMYSTLQFGKGEVEFLLKKIDEVDLEIRRRKKMNDNYINVNNKLTSVYAEMENVYIRTHEDIYNLTNVREKIQHCEGLMKYLLQCKKDQQLSVLGGDARLNNSNNSSFGSNNDSFLYNTRSDSSLNSTGFFARSETAVSRPTYTLSNQLNEIKTFMNTPIDKFKWRNPTHNHLGLCANPLVNVKLYDQLPKDVKLLVFDYLMTPVSSIKCLRSQIYWFSQMAEIQSAFIAPDNLPEVEESKLIAKRNEQNNALAEVTDEISALCANTYRVFDNIQRCVKYVKGNPLTKFMSTTETFNGKTYYDYERDFMMYYRMIQNTDGV